MKITLASRDLTATDASPVNGANVALTAVPWALSATFVVSTTGTPTTYDMRAAIEVSPDGGTTWNQVCRFADVTNTAAASRLARFAGVAAAAEAAIAASNLANAAASGIVVDTPWPLLVRAVTKLQTLTGGTTPHVISAVYLEV